MPAAMPERIADEVGDLLFAVVNLARRLETDPEQALRGACRKFERRFRAIEAAPCVAREFVTEAAGLDEMEAEWQRAKADEEPRGSRLRQQVDEADVSQRLPPRSWTRA